MTDVQEKISVIVPVYKVEKYLDRCVSSIKKQTYRNLEIILVDDGSPDRCPQMCDAWAECDSRIRVIHKENGGLSDARNAGMGIASGIYISFIDSDDWIDLQMYERLVTAMKRDQSDIAACGVKIVWEDGSPDGIFLNTADCVLSRQEAQKELLKERLIKHPVWYKLYKSDRVKDLLFDVGRIHEDVFWSYKAIGAANKVSLINYVGYFYFQRNGSIMSEEYSLQRLDALTAYCKRYEYMQREFPELTDKALCLIWLKCIYDGQQSIKYLSRDERERAFKFFMSVRKKYPIKKENYKQEAVSIKIWLSLSRVSLKRTCQLKNLLKIGF